MTQIEQVEKKPMTVHQLLKAQNTEAAFQKVLGKRADQYIASIITMVNNNELVKKCEPVSLVNTCIIAATLDLSIDPNFGFAYVVPYTNKKTGLTVAQFQIGYKGLVQLAIRTGEYRRLGANEIYEDQLIGFDKYNEPIFDFDQRDSKKVIGYMAYFELLNGFEKSIFWHKDEIEKHARRYSQAYKKDGTGFGPWKDNFDGMAKKTALKLLLSKFAPLSTQMQKAINDDQKIEEEYLDNKITFDVKNASIEGESIETKAIETEAIEETTEWHGMSEEEEADAIMQREAEAFEAEQRAAAQEVKDESVDPQYPKGKPVLQGNMTDSQRKRIMGTWTRWEKEKSPNFFSLKTWYTEFIGDKSRGSLTKQEAHDLIAHIEYLEKG